MKVFQCSHSGLLLPLDYGKEWGRKYGIGLGPTPVSECVDVSYWRDLPAMNQSGIRRADQIMHPVTPTFAQVDLVEVPYEKWEDVPAELKMVLRCEPRSRERRAAILLELQRKKSQELRMAHYEAQKAGMS